MRRKHIRTVGAWLATALLLGTGACGYLADKGEESRGTENLPSQGIGPWSKLDQVCQEEQVTPPGAAPDLSLQAVVIPAPLGRVVGEPSVLGIDDETLWVYYESRGSRDSKIRRAVLRLGPAELCRPATVELLEDEVVLEAVGRGFEGVRVGAPTAIDGALPGVSSPHRYAMYYAGGEGAGIGLAVSADGRSFRRIGRDGLPGDVVEPLLAPVDGGWEAGAVGSPAIARAPDGRYLLYFDGNRDAVRSIGVAVGVDGVGFERIDGEGRVGVAASPILTPTFEGPEEQTNWEFLRSDDPTSGSVGTPMVLLDRGPARDIFLMYYTGNLRGPLLDDYGPVDTSIGVAASFDGITWRKASTLVDYPAIANEVNPVLNEVFPLCLANDDPLCLVLALEPFFDVFFGDDGFCRQPANESSPLCSRFDPGDGQFGSGSSNSTNPLLIVDEAEPSVAALSRDRFVMIYHQQSDGLGALTALLGDPTGGLPNGIAVAFNNF